MVAAIELQASPMWDTAGCPMEGPRGRTDLTTKAESTLLSGCGATCSVTFSVKTTDVVTEPIIVDGCSPYPFVNSRGRHFSVLRTELPDGRVDSA